MPDTGGTSRPARGLWLMRATSAGLLGTAGWLYWQGLSAESSPAPAPRATAVRPAPAAAPPGAPAAATPRGFAAAANGALWQTSADADRRWQLALCEELSDAIGRITAVRRAQVFITFGRSNGFADAPPQAAVMVEPQPGSYLPRTLVPAVRSLVCGAVPNLPPERVAVVDARTGRVLDAAPAGATGEDPDADLRRAATATQARLSDGLNTIKGLRVEVWPVGTADDERLASFTPSASGDASAAAGGDRTLRLSSNLSARLVVPAEQVAQFAPEAAGSSVAWQQAKERLAARLRSQAAQLAPTMPPDSIVVEFDDAPLPSTAAATRLSGSHLLLGLVLCAALAGYAWGRPIPRAATG